MLSKLQLAGCSPAKLKLVIITHGDFDHAGNGARLQQKYQAKIAMHGADAEIAASGKPLKHKAHTLTGKLLLAITNLAQTDIRFETFQPDILLDNGDRLDQYGLNAQIIHTPGHTNGSIMVMRHLI